MSSNDITYSIVIPVYNSTESLEELVYRLIDLFTRIVEETYEIILIDDASPNPDTWKMMEHLVEKFDTIKIIQLRRNFGKAGAVLCGFEQARGEYIFTLDDDLQHLPEDIPKFIRYRDHDVVMGRYVRKNHPFLKRFTSRIKGLFDWHLAGKPSHLQSNPFRLYKKDVAKSMLRMRTPFPFISAMMYYTTHDIVTVAIDHGKRSETLSGFNMWKRFKSFSNLLFNHSSFLLRVVSAAGVSISIASFLLGIYYILKNVLIGRPIPGWTSLIVVTLFTNGLLLFAIGVIGEYLIRIIKGIEHRPPFIVRRIYHKPDATIAKN